MVQPSAPAQHCILPPDAAVNFGSSPSTPQSRSGAHAGVSMPLRDATPRPSVQQPHLGARRWRQQIPCAAGAGACSRAASLGVSLWSCKNFIVKVRPRSFSRLASPLCSSSLATKRFWFWFDTRTAVITCSCSQTKTKTEKAN